MWLVLSSLALDSVEILSIFSRLLISQLVEVLGRLRSSYNYSSDIFRLALNLASALQMNFKSPERVILFEVVKSFVGISILPADFVKRFRNFNSQSAAGGEEELKLDK